MQQIAATILKPVNARLLARETEERAAAIVPEKEPPSTGMLCRATMIATVPRKRAFRKRTTGGFQSRHDEKSGRMRDHSFHRMRIARPDSAPNIDGSKFETHVSRSVCRCATVASATILPAYRKGDPEAVDRLSCR